MLVRPVIKFGPFEFDAAAGLLYQGDEETLLPPKAAGVLHVLLGNPSQLVTKDELLEKVWAGSYVTESSLTDAISLLRQVLGDDSRDPTYIQTLHRRGYRFIANLEAEAAEAPVAESEATPLVEPRVPGEGGLKVGERLGNYEILGTLGAGAMGTVYRARDTTLEREVAIKLLRADFADDPERLARLEREAKLLASVSHPNIAAVHSLEEAAGIRFPVLELVEGETLEERLCARRMEVNDALEIGRQIASAVAAAHDKGIIHRDLKPANIKITPEGQVKVLDFGLAKGIEVMSFGQNAAEAPTGSLTIRGTGRGSIVGTVAYMSPEQARGKPVDKRTDIWAFGCVLYETLTGKRAFDGETVSDTLAKVLTQEPDWQRLATAVPDPVLRVLRRCLSKDVQQRYRDIGDVRLELQETLDVGVDALPAAGGGSAAPAVTRGWRIASAALAVAAIAGWISVLMKPGGESISSTDVTRLSFHLQAEEMIAVDMDVRLFDISADGRYIAWVSPKEPRQIYVRSLDSHEVRALPGTEGAVNASVEFSPDVREVAYLKDGNLWTAPLDGGIGQSLYTAESETDFWDFDWAADGSLYISVAFEGIFRLAGAEEELEPIHTQGSPAWVRVLPGSRAILFAGGPSDTLGFDLHVLPLDDPQAAPRRILEGVTFAEYAPSGHLVYWSEGTIYAVEFDLDALDVRGASRAIIVGAQPAPRSNAGEFAFANDGTLVYLPEQGLQAWRLAWVSTDGTHEYVDAPAGGYGVPRISPSGDRFSVLRGSRIYANAFQGTGLRSLTALEQSIWTYAWNGDDPAWVFSAFSPRRIYVQPATSGANAVELADATDLKGGASLLWAGVSDVSPDGTSILLSTRLPRDVSQVQMYDVETGEFSAITSDGHSASGARFSPDGRWIAYVSDEEGAPSIFVRNMLNGEAGRGIRASEGVGWYPVWSRDGDEIFYVDGDGQRLLAAPFRADPEPGLGAERLVFESPEVEFPAPGWIFPGHTFDVGPDGRFLFVARGPIREMQVNVTLNWFEELKRLVPTER